MDKDFMLHYFNKAVQSEWEKLLKTPCYQQTVCKRDTTERESFQLLGYFAYVTLIVSDRKLKINQNKRRRE